MLKRKRTISKEIRNELKNILNAIESNQVRIRVKYWKNVKYLRSIGYKVRRIDKEWILFLPA